MRGEDGWKEVVTYIEQNQLDDSQRYHHHESLPGKHREDQAHVYEYTQISVTLSLNQKVR